MFLPDWRIDGFEEDLLLFGFRVACWLMEENDGRLRR